MRKSRHFIWIAALLSLTACAPPVQEMPLAMPVAPVSQEVRSARQDICGTYWSLANVAHNGKRSGVDKMHLRRSVYTGLMEEDVPESIIRLSLAAIEIGYDETFETYSSAEFTDLCVGMVDTAAAMG